MVHQRPSLALHIVEQTRHVLQIYETIADLKDGDLFQTRDWYVLVTARLKHRWAHGCLNQGSELQPIESHNDHLAANGTSKRPSLALHIVEQTRHVLQIYETIADLKDGDLFQTRDWYVLITAHLKHRWAHGCLNQGSEPEPTEWQHDSTVYGTGMFSSRSV